MGRYNFILFYLILSLLSCVSCQNSYNTSSEQNNVEITNSTSETIEKVDPFAIGEIKMGCSKQDFLKFKQDFLDRNPNIAGLNIEQFKGFFDGGKLVRIIIISCKHKNHFDPLRESNSGWQYLYKIKYPNFEEYDKELFKGIQIKKSSCIVYVSDYILNNAMPSSFKYDFYTNPFDLNNVYWRRCWELYVDNQCRDLDNKCSDKKYQPLLDQYSMIDICALSLVREREIFISNQKKAKEDSKRNGFNDI